jgi:hypothetical protein
MLWWTPFFGQKRPPSLDRAAALKMKECQCIEFARAPQRRTFHKMQYKTTCDFVDYAEVAMELELDQGLVKVKNIPRPCKLDSLNCFHIEGRHKVVEGHTFTAFTAK